MIDSPSPMPHPGTDHQIGVPGVVERPAVHIERPAVHIERPAVHIERPAVHIDCHTCTARPMACGDCVVTFLLGAPPGEQGDLDATEVAALAVLADSGLVPPLRLVHPLGQSDIS